MPCHCARIASCHCACHSVPCHFVSFRVISCHFVSFVSIRVISCHCVSFRVISCHFVIVCLSARLGQICHRHCVPFGTSWSGLSLSLHAFRHVLVRFVIVIACLLPFGTSWSDLSLSRSSCSLGRHRTVPWNYPSWFLANRLSSVSLPPLSHTFVLPSVPV